MTMSFVLHWTVFALLLLGPAARQGPDAVVLEHDDALQREALAFETRLLNVSSSLHSTVEVRQAASAAATIARLQREKRKSATPLVTQRSIKIAARNLGHTDHHYPKISSRNADALLAKYEHSAPSLRTSSSSPSSNSTSFLSSNLPSRGFVPGDSASPFRLYTTKGVLNYPDDLFFRNVSILFLTFNNQSGFSSVSWTNPASLQDFVTSAPDDARFVFFSAASEPAVATADVLWMRSKLQRTVEVLRKRPAFIPDGKLKDFVKDRCAFVVTPMTQLGNWIPSIQQQWACSGHGCGLDQIVFEARNSWLPLILKRLDARYDWLPNPFNAFKNKTLPARILRSNGCRPQPHLEGVVAVIVKSGGCDFADKIVAMNVSDAKAVVFVTSEGDEMKEIVCLEDECELEVDIPASVIPFSHFFSSAGANLTVRFQNTPSPNLCFTVDRLGKLGECGWLLYPSLRFYSWQAQWLSYEESLRRELREVEGESVETPGKISSDTKSTSHPKSFSAVHDVPVISSLHYQSSSSSSPSSKHDSPSHVSSRSSPNSNTLVLEAFDFTPMQGKAGVVASVKLPSAQVLRQNVTRLRLDASLSCLGDRDEDCPPWDHTVHLLICCDDRSVLCGTEIGRWITPFRRRIGRWMTDVTPLLPLLKSPTGRCNVTMKTVAWAKPWKPALRFLLTLNPGDPDVLPKNRSTPTTTFPLFRGGRFDSDYNSNYEPQFFLIPRNVVKVVVVAVITGHGSDDHQCGEFCPTSHVFSVNGKVYNKTFEDAGKPLGCAETVLGGSIPNEHGTWLYGRGGWCDGRQVDPWVIDVTGDVKKRGRGRGTEPWKKNSVWEEEEEEEDDDDGGILAINYRGQFEGKDPNPMNNPGEIIMYSYLTMYKMT